MVVIGDCDRCGAANVPVEDHDGFAQCGRCKVGEQGVGSDRDALMKSAQAMFRAIGHLGLRAVEILEAAAAVGEKPITDFLALAERGNAYSKHDQRTPSVMVVRPESER
jgi:hypothetical protein